MAMFTEAPVGVFDALKAEEETWEGGHGGLAAAARASGR